MTAAIAVVVPTYERVERLERLLAALEQQDIVEPFEVVVVDDGSSPQAAARIDTLAAASPISIRVLHQSNTGPSVARDRGWRSTTAPVVAFTDDDCRPAAGWLRALAAAAADAEVVQGRTRPDPTQLDRLGPFSRTLDVSEEGLFPTCNVAYHRSILERLDGFDPRYRWSCDDTDLAWRAKEAGARTTFAADALVDHEISASSVRGLLRTLPRWDGVALAAKTHPDLRRFLDHRVFWRASHLPAIAAMVGLIGFIGGGSRSRRGLAALLLVPYVRFRVSLQPLPGIGRKRRVILLPLALAVDLAEVAVMAKASIEHRTLVL
jgi:glycosyltransferase involved in cell wall biosynthesis